MDEFRINRITDKYKYLDEEIKARNNLKKKYIRASNVCLGIEAFLLIFELGITGSTIAVPVIVPISAPIVVALTACSAVLKSIGRLTTKKNQQTFRNHVVGRIQTEFTRRKIL